MIFQTLLTLAVVAQAGPTAKSGPKPYVSAKGKYTVTMPARPTEKTRFLAVGGKSIDLVIASARKDSATFSAAHADLGGADPEAGLKAGQEEVVSQSRGELKEEKPVSLGDVSGRELTIEVPRKVVAGGANVTARLFVVSGRLYVLTATVPSSRAEALADDVAAFLDSFEPSGVQVEPKVAVAKPEKSAKAAKSSKTARATKPSGKAAAAAKDEKPAMTGSPLGGLAALNPFAAKPAAPAPAPAEPAKAAAPLGPDWKDFTPPDNAFVVKFPGVPQRQTRTVTTALGQGDIQGYTAKLGETMFAVIVTGAKDKPAGMEAAAYLAASKGGYLASQNGKLLSERTLEIDGLPGLELVTDVPQGPSMPVPGGAIVTCRLFVIKDNMVAVTTTTPKGSAAHTDSAGFFDSFRLSANGRSAVAGAAGVAMPPNPAAGVAVGAPIPVNSSAVAGNPVDALGAGWREYTVKDSNFSAAFPSAPKEMKLPVKTPVGEVTANLFAVEQVGKPSYIVAANEIPGNVVPAMHDTILEGSKKGGLASTPGATMSDEKTIQYQGFPGREFTLTVPAPTIPGGGKIRMRILLAKNRLYQMQVIIPGNLNPSDEEVAGFFESLKILRK